MLKLENDFLTAEMTVLLYVFIGGHEGPDELLDQSNHNNPWRDGVHSSQY